MVDNEQRQNNADVINFCLKFLDFPILLMSAKIRLTFCNSLESLLWAKYAWTVKSCTINRHQQKIQITNISLVKTFSYFFLLLMFFKSPGPLQRTPNEFQIFQVPSRNACIDKFDFSSTLGYHSSKAWSPKHSKAVTCISSPNSPEFQLEFSWETCRTQPLPRYYVRSWR